MEKMMNSDCRRDQRGLGKAMDEMVERRLFTSNLAPYRLRMNWPPGRRAKETKLLGSVGDLLGALRPL